MDPQGGLLHTCSPEREPGGVAQVSSCVSTPRQSGERRDDQRQRSRYVRGFEPEFSSEGSIEVRYVTKPASKGNVDDAVCSRHEPHRRLAKARAQDVRMRRHARKALERPEEVKRAQPRITRPAIQGKRRLRSAVDH